jgi:hypothetical protein
MALHMVSLVALVILTLLDAYLAQGLYDSARYIAGLKGGVCSWIGGLQGLGLVLPWVFLALGSVATVQVLFWGRFRISVAFLILHVMHMTLVLSLLVLGNSYCDGASVLRAIQILSGPILFGLVFAALPVPLLMLQLRAMRVGRGQAFDRL